MPEVHLIYAARSLQLSLEGGRTGLDLVWWPALVADVLRYAFGEQDAFFVIDVDRAPQLDWMVPTMRSCGVEITDGTHYQVFYAQHCGESLYTRLTHSRDFESDAVWIAQPVAHRSDLGSVVAGFHGGTTIMWLNPNHAPDQLRRDIHELSRAYGCSLRSH